MRSIAWSVESGVPSAVGGVEQAFVWYVSQCGVWVSTGEGGGGGKSGLGENCKWG